MTLPRVLKIIAVVLFLIAFFVAAGWVDTDAEALAPIPLIALGLALTTAAEAA